MSSILNRRQALVLLGAASATASFGTIGFADGLESRKLVLVILRGGMDGLAALIPDDPAVESERAELSAPAAQRRAVNADFALHPALTELHKMFVAGEAAFVHACATAYRERSHFDGQDFLETLAPPGEREGWLNRALQALPGTSATAVGAALPIVLRGAAPASSWSPSVFHPASDDLLDRLQDMYAGDTMLANALTAARATSMTAPETDMRGRRDAYADLLGAAGRLMAADGGPGVCVVSLEGWDTHANQAAQLNRRFGALDEGLSALKTALGGAWGQSVVLCVSEFGRTFAANGTAGADHGTGGLVILAGGAVNGGRMFGDWPGLARTALYQDRDLYPANDMVSVFKGVLRDHLGISQTELASRVFPGGGRAFDGLVTARA